jgi:geranylgeranyl transferase type-2 subunit beta
MSQYSDRLRSFCLAAVALSFLAANATAAEPPKAEDVLRGLRKFADSTVQPDGSFRPGVDAFYPGMSDSAYSDLAPVTYAIVIHKTFGWPVPNEANVRAWLLSRQGEDGAFFNMKGTASSAVPAGRVYNTTMGLMALHGLGLRPKHDPIPVFAKVLERDYKYLPPYSSSFFPLAYKLAGQRLPDDADRVLRATMIQAEDGYLNDHIAATFHAVHYDQLVARKTMNIEGILARVLREQKADGSWMLNPLARDRHACFDAVFVLKQLGADRPECRRAIERAADWALSCRNADGGFGHYPGSTSDWDAVYFHVGTLVMAGRLPRAPRLPPAPHLLGWGHLFPGP